MVFTRKIAVVAAVSDEKILRENLLRSSLFSTENIPFFSVSEAPSAGIAYNQGLKHFSTFDIVILVHQDVYIPKNWMSQLQMWLDELDEKKKEWGVLGVYGKASNNEGIGRVWDTGLSAELGSSFDQIFETESLDELLLIVNCKNNLFFDENLDGFHLFAIDFCESARAAGKPSYVIHAPVIHNSKRIRSLGGSYYKAYRYLQKKWRDKLPLYSVCSPITKWGIRYQRMRLGLARRRIFGRLPLIEVGSLDPVIKARELGYE